MVVATPNPIEIHTAEDLADLPSSERYELIRGRYIDMAPPGGEHGYVTSQLAALVTVFVRGEGLGYTFTAETGFIVARDPDTVLAPDFAFITKVRLTGPVPQAYVTVIPDLVLETRSPSDREREVALKVERWLQAGVRMVWDLDPKRRVLVVHRATGLPQIWGANDTLQGDDVLPGFTVALHDILPDEATGSVT